MASRFRAHYSAQDPYQTTEGVLYCVAKSPENGRALRYLELDYWPLTELSSAPPQLHFVREYVQLFCPGLVHVHDAVVDTEAYRIGIVTEFIPGYSLAERSTLQWSEPIIWAVLQQVGTVLQYMHNAFKQELPGVHRLAYGFLSPSSIYLSDETHLMVDLPPLPCLLGLVPPEAFPKAIRRYLAPEVLAGKRVCEQSDSWSLGAIIYELCTNQPLFDPKFSVEALLGYIEVMADGVVLPGYSSALTEVVSGLLQKDPLSRLTMTELLCHPSILRLTREKSAAPTLDRSSISKSSHEIRKSFRQVPSISTSITDSESSDVRRPSRHPSSRDLEAQQTGSYPPERFSMEAQRTMGLSTTLFSSGSWSNPHLETLTSDPIDILDPSSPKEIVTDVKTPDSAETHTEKRPRKETPRKAPKAQKTPKPPKPSKSRSSSRASSRASRKKEREQSTAFKSIKEEQEPTPIASTSTCPPPDYSDNEFYKPSSKLDSELAMWVDDIVINVLQRQQGRYTVDDIRNRLIEIVPGMRTNDGIALHSPSDIIALNILAAEVDKRLEPYKTFMGGRRASEGSTYNQSTLQPSLLQSSQSLGQEPSLGTSLSKDVTIDDGIPILPSDRRLLRSRHPSARPPASTASTRPSTTRGDQPLHEVLNSTSGFGTQSRLSASLYRTQTIDDYNESVSDLRTTDWKKQWSVSTYAQHVVPGDVKTFSAPAVEIKYTSLMKAATLGDVDAVKRVLALEGGLKTRHGVTALMLAALEGQTECVKVLQPIEARMVDADGLPALSYAARSGYVEVCRLLAKDEAHILSEARLSALMIACDNNQYAVVNYLRGYCGKQRGPQGETALMRAARAGNLALCTELCEAEVGVQSDSGDTALMVAAREGVTAVVQLLAKHELRIQNNQGQTALMIAAGRKNLSSVQLLLDEAGARDSFEETALMKAVKANAPDVAQCLLAAEAGCQRGDGKTALMYAAEGGYVSLIGLLIDQEAGLVTREGGTALMLAAQRNRPEVVPLLIPLESKKQRLNGETALMAAIRAGSRECVELLLDYEGDMTMANGQTNLETAELTGNAEIIELLCTWIKNQPSTSKEDEGCISLELSVESS
ncbi:Kinase, NEK [Giardia muris]|uniref:Kinase, NEK n=1 Tax=Giardia muris TaxID=5742 RepID=A0A4Z1SXD0_GIAMU|nr:Kinase, NEK [Giardia muris]|eukprot:TNJ30384.1 Kinase, NEK [Giardia muris]